MTERNTGFIGLGAMGAPMARHLAQAGRLLGVANRSHDKAVALAAECGVAAFQDLSELASACTIVFVCVSADQDVKDVVRALRPGLKPGAIVVDTSTVSAATAQELAAELAPSGVGFLDAPLTGGVEGARNGKLSVMVGGGPEVLERVRGAIACFAARITHMGPVGAGQSTKAVNQVLVAGIAEAVCEGLAFGEALGLPRESLLTVLTGGAANSWFLEKRGRSMLEGNYEGGFKLGLLHKDLLIVREMLRGLGVHSTIVNAALADYSELKAQGRGDEEISALVRLKRAQYPSQA